MERYSDDKPLSKSAVISATFSKPTPRRNNESVIPALLRSSSVSRPCVVVDG